ncbi:hypothetical protein L873DRAFT_1687439 [Choiromyces venosus 120613-1]|uniref:BTB domain-containing protein n=1 Tax=Choiromyces venosus 120613-1 TaxID=1336337 RepID=A0A3N4JJW4_9PEZI|nr:hypothetical protein L873DRAFT_1687439 [Choiromyces venosus 120613-1]
MALQSDRLTPISEEKNGPLEGLKWNNWIFQEIAGLYLLFLRHLMKLHGRNGYIFWPAPPSEFKNSDYVSLAISEEFWKKASKSDFNLYPPLPSPLSTPRKTQSKAVENLSIGEAIFDFLVKDESSLIVPLLAQLGIANIVTHLPPPVKKGLTAATGHEVSPASITPAYVRNLLQNPTRCKLLHDHWKKDPKNLMSNINKLLLFLLQDTSDDCLVGCSLLPLDGGGWGTFLRTSTSQVQYFISETPLERSILEASNGNLVSKGLLEPVVDGLLKKNINISRLSFDHIATLCRQVESKDPKYRRTWLINVWEYFELCVVKYPTQNGQYLRSIESLPVYCGSVVGGQDSLRFFTPLSFVSGGLPAVIGPGHDSRKSDDSTLLGALNGLILVNRSTFPKARLSNELLDSTTGVHRLIKAIKSLPYTMSQVFSGVPTDGIRALSNLILPRISELLNLDHSIVGTLKQLPIWPVLSQSTFQSATKLKLAPHANMTSTNMIDQTTFLEPWRALEYKAELQKLGVPKLSNANFLNEELGLARRYLPAEKIGVYRVYIEKLHKENPDLFNSFNLAVDGNLRFCLPSTLYDSSATLFQAAFRGQESSRFLHPGLANSHVWKDFLIKTVSGPTYIECARSIERRNNQTIPDNQIETDSHVVFEHLRWDHQEMRSWRIWDELLQIRFAPVQEVISSGQSPLRMKQKEKFRQWNKLIAISAAVDPKYEKISWSQKAVLRGGMGPLPLRLLNSKKPMITPTIVIKHLEFLSSNREEITKQELPTRISEIKAAYEYLEEEIPNYTIQKTALIWLNIENDDLTNPALETFQKSWLCTNNLCLGTSYDSGEIKRVRSFLDRFRQLLPHANVSSLKPPRPLTPEPPSTGSPILEGLLELRKQRLLFDVTITARKPAGPLQTFKAHKIVLASVSDYWKGMFTSKFMESSTAEVSLPDDPSTVEVLLDFVYTNNFIKAPHEDNVTIQLENLLDQLEKSEKWLLPSFKRSMEHYLSDAHWIRPETVKSILKSAKTYNADQLTRVCQKYIEDNRDIVERETAKEESVSHTWRFFR